MRPVLIMTVGLPGSGKSTVAKNYINGSDDIELFSSDALRAELWGDENTQGDNQQLFTELHRRIKNCLREGKSAIYDATNINYKKRMAFLQELKHIECKKVCWVFAVPYEVCLERNANRNRIVPEYVIERMYKNFTIPYWYEGWDDIHIINDFGEILNPLQFITDNICFNQDNYHHNLTLGKHCASAYLSLDDLSNFDLQIATLIHDNGKIFTKDFHNKHGEETEEAHYYGHQYVGAYNSLFYEDINDHLYVAQLIQWHMHPYTVWKDSIKAMNRDKSLLGEELFNDITILHKADVDAH